MKKDIRIDTGFFTHPKTLKLIRNHGLKAVWGLLRLWAYARIYRPKGELYGLEPSDFAEILGIRGGQSNFKGGVVQLLEGIFDAGFFDKSEDGIFTLHDWEEHQPYAFYQTERSDKARKSAAQRWGDKEGKGERGDAKRNANGNAKRNAKRNAEGISNANAPNPFPSPIPTPTPKTKDSFPPELFSSEGEHDKLATLFAELLLTQIPQFRELQSDKKPKTLERYRKDFRLMIERDKRTPESIEAVIRFVRADAFWQVNILSVDKLRAKFDQLETKMKSQGGNNGAGGQRAKASQESFGGDTSRFKGI